MEEKKSNADGVVVGLLLFGIVLFFLILWFAGGAQLSSVPEMARPVSSARELQARSAAELLYINRRLDWEEFSQLEKVEWGELSKQRADELIEKYERLRRKQLEEARILLSE